MTIDDVFNRVAQASIPGSLAYAVGAIYKFVSNLPAVTGELSIVEAFVQISLAAISAIAPIMGSVAVVVSVYMAGKWRLYQAESKRLDEAREHEREMAKLGKTTTQSSGDMLRIPSDFPFESAKAAKPDEPTVDLK